MKVHRSKARKGFTAIELLFIFASLIVALFLMLKVSAWVMQSYYRDGSDYLSSPLL